MLQRERQDFSEVVEHFRAGQLGRRQVGGHHVLDSEGVAVAAGARSGHHRGEALQSGADFLLRRQLLEALAALLLQIRETLLGKPAS